jgi:hypothetical protein
MILLGHFVTKNGGSIERAQQAAGEGKMLARVKPPEEQHRGFTLIVITKKKQKQKTQPQPQPTKKTEETRSTGSTTGNNCVVSFGTCLLHPPGEGRKYIFQN